MRKLIYILLTCWIWTGCASEQSYRDYTVAYTGWTAIKAKQEVKNKELLRIEAIEGQPITITAKTFVVYMPNSKEDENAIPPPQQVKDSEWTGAVKTLFDGAKTVGLAAIFGNTASNVVGSLASAKGNTTTTSTSTTTSNANQQNTDSHDSSSANQQNTTSTSSTDSHNTTTSTDSHNTTITDSHNTATTSTPTTTTTTTGATGTTTGGTVTQ